MPAKKCPPVGAPEWVLTYGDMMSLLLVFFIMLVAMSEIKKEDEYKAIVQEVQKAFGMHGGGGKTPTDDDPALSLMQRLEALNLQQQREENEANTTDPGMEGREASVTQVREGVKFAVGGRITFEPGSADLSEEARRQLRAVVEKHRIRGTNNIIELRGHAAPMELAVGGGTREFSDLWELSHARAATVMRFLTGTEIGLAADRFRVIAAADSEPLARRAYTVADQEANRRVEMLVSETLVQDLAKPERGRGG